MSSPKGRHGIWLAAGIGAICLAGFVWMWSQDRAFKNRVDDQLNHSTEAAVAAVDADSFVRLAARPEDAVTEDYRRLREQLAGLTEVFEGDGLLGLYAMKQEGEEIRFFVDSAPSDDPWHSEPGTVYQEVSQSVLDVFADGKKRIVGPETDEYGTFYSALVPVVGPDGVTVAVMGADFDAAAYDKALWTRRAPIVAITALVVALYVLISVWLRYRQQRLRYIRTYTKRLEVLIDQMPVGILIAEGQKGFPTMTNAAAVAMLGRDIDSSKGVADFVETYGIVREDGAPYPTADLPLSVTLATGRQTAKAGMFIAQKDGSKIAIRMASVPIHDEKEKISAVLLVMEDMTKEYEIDRQKSEFISVASHELRAPLTAIKWNTDLLLDEREGTLNEEQATYARHINEINTRLVTLVNELLDVSRLDTGTIGVAPAKTDITALIESVIGDLTGLFEKKRQKLAYRRRALPEIDVDARLVRQVMVNLLSNAVKFTPIGGKIGVTAEAVGDDLRVSVADSGIGIPKAQQSQVFKKFFRADNAKANDIEGTGLGLYICKQAIELSGGALGFESEENGGATFWFTLPLSGSVKKAASRRKT